MPGPTVGGAGGILFQAGPSGAWTWFVYIVVVALGFAVGYVVVSRVLRRRRVPTPSDPGASASGPPAGRDERYRVLRTIGSGAHGVVHLARDTVLDREVVIKHLRTPGLGDEARHRVLREARTAGRVSHPNVVAVYDVTRLGEDDVIVMEYVRGGSLLDRLKDGPLPPRQAVAIAAGVLRGLQRLHDAGVVHRDVKPGNILLTADGTPKVSDLGVAHFGDGPAVGGQPGTVRYMSPEQVRGEAIGPATDVWAVAVLLHEAVTGRHPLGNLPTDADMLRRAVAGAATALAVDRLPAGLVPVLQRALAARPGDRFASAKAFRRALAGALDA